MLLRFVKYSSQVESKLLDIVNNFSSYLISYSEESRGISNNTRLAISQGVKTASVETMEFFSRL